MHNVTHVIDGGKLIITIDISAKTVQSAPPSSSGKTSLVATTGGAVSIASPNGAALSFALNVMAKKS